MSKKVVSFVKKLKYNYHLQLIALIKAGPPNANAGKRKQVHHATARNIIL